MQVAEQKTAANSKEVGKRRRLRWLAFAIVFASVVMQVMSIRQESQTYDEAVHLFAGYVYWRTGDLRWNEEHPPLGKYLNALPLLLLHPRLPTEHRSWKEREQGTAAQEFLYHNTSSARKMLFWGRLVTILLTVILGLSVQSFVRSYAGDIAGLCAMALVLFEPNIIAHGRYVTTDMPLTLFAFLAASFWLRFLEGGRWRWSVGAGLALGAALASKFSGIVFIPAIFAITILHLLFQRPILWQRLLGGLLSMTAIAAITVSLVYSAEGFRLIPGIRLIRPDLPALQDLPASSPTAKTVLYLGHHLALADSTWIRGLVDVAEHEKDGHPSYLMGQLSEHGWWYYFPVAFAVKTSAALIFAMIAAAVAWCASGRRRAVLIVSLLIPTILFFAVAMLSQMNLGIRHILPVYPFIAATVAIALATCERKSILVACAALAFVESCVIYPYYVSFFNPFVGGPSQGARYLLDSNIDWGQDLYRLEAYLDAHGADHVCLAYFGQADKSMFGFREEPILSDPAERSKMDCFAVASLTELYGVYDPTDRLAWLRGRKPDDRIGYSMNVYDLRHR
jgi:4-amino-4-deoxy-L-arabinose transferase-like glycosyltransferase